MKRLAGLFVAAFLGGFASLTVYDHYKDTQRETNVSDVVLSTDQINANNTQLVNLPAVAPEARIDFTRAAENSTHAVVHVKTSYKGKTYEYYDPFKDFFLDTQIEHTNPNQKMSSGSGVIISDDGYIVTNNHVIDGGDEIEVVLNDKRTYTATVIGADPTTDLALLKLNGEGFPYIPYGNSDELKVGEWVLAVGNPFNLNSTVTAGIVSAKGRNINILQEEFAIESFIQTDAAVNPGNSGGALVNTNGELVGINTAIASTTGAYAGYSFAVPVNMAMKVVDDLLQFGMVQRAFIGVSIKDIDSELAEKAGIEVQEGVFVMGLTEGGAASEAGVEAGDIIIKVGEGMTKNTSSLQENVARYRPGDKVNVTLIRDGKTKIVPLLLRNKNGTTNTIKKVENSAVTALGAEFEPVSSTDKKRLRIDNGVKISKLNGGKLRSAGIKEGFIITKVDKRKVSNAEELLEALGSKKGGVLIEGIYPNGYRSYYGFGL